MFVAIAFVVVTATRRNKDCACSCFTEVASKYWVEGNEPEVGRVAMASAIRFVAATLAEPFHDFADPASAALDCFN